MEEEIYVIFFGGLEGINNDLIIVLCCFLVPFFYPEVMWSSRSFCFLQFLCFSFPPHSPISLENRSLEQLSWKLFTTNLIQKLGSKVYKQGKNFLKAIYYYPLKSFGKTPGCRLAQMILPLKENYLRTPLFLWLSIRESN